MVERTNLENGVRQMVAYDILQAPLSSLYQKAKRRLTKLAGEVSDLVGEEERIFAKVERRTQEKARTLKEGIAAFSKKHPRYGRLLKGMIAEKRVKRKRILVYGISEGFSLGSEDYVRVMRELGFEREAACAMYPHLKQASDELGKASEYDRREVLLK